MWDCATPATWSQGGCHQVPRLPRKVPRRHAGPSGPKRATQCHERHTCHAKRPWMWDCATPATWNQGGCEIVPRLPRGTKVDVTKRHACHAKCRGVKRDQAGPSAPPSAMSATPATQNDSGCEIVPCLPREIKVDVRLCHACHVEPRWMSPSATPATQSAAASRATKRAQARHPVPWVPCLPRKTTVDVRLCHACHVKPRWMWDCATPATWNQSGCHQVPRLPRKVLRRHARPRGPKRATQWHERHACHAKRQWTWDATQRWLLTDGVWQSCVWSYCLWKMVCDKMVFVVCEVIVCERGYVTSWYLTDGMWQSCVLSLCVWSYCMWKMVCDKVVC